jgi:hypothetical protein
MAPIASSARVCSRALGIELSMPGVGLGLPPVTGAPAARSCTLELVDQAELDRRWPDEGTKRIIDRKADDEVTKLLTLDVHENGYRYWAIGFGAFLMSLDGTHVACAPETPDPARWQRFLIGQILPFVTLLQGLEVMHGSAVALDGRAVGFIGGSGAGKTSIAAHLLLRGAGLVADDVLALERNGKHVLVHPGPGVIGVRHAEVERLASDDLPRLGKAVADNEKEVLFEVRREEQPLPLGVLYFIFRDDDARELTVERTRDASLLLAGTFNTVLSGRDRLEHMLDLFAAVSHTAEVFRVVVPPSVGAAELAEELHRHVADTVTPR